MNCGDNASESRATELIVHPLAVRGRDEGAQLEVGPEGGPYNALRAGDGGSSRQSLVAITERPIAFAWQAGGNNDASGAFETDMTPTLPKSQTLAVAFQRHGSNVGPMGTLRAGNGNESGGVPFTTTETTVRRLTPRECERLQGFPDDWTATSYGKPQADSPRYQQMGNAVAVPVFEWVARRIMEVA